MPQLYRCNRLPLLDRTVILVLASDVGHMERCGVVTPHPVGDGGIGCQLYDVAVGFDNLVVPDRLPAEGFLPVPADGCDGGVLGRGRAMDDKVGDVSHGYSSGFRRG